MTKYFLLLLSLLAADALSAQRASQVQQDQARIRNVEFTVMEEGRVSITYDLIGSETDRYWVKINLRMNEGEDFQPLRGVTGDVGSVQPGRGRTATWSALEQFPFGIDSSDATFRVSSEVTARKTGGGSGVLAGLLVVGGIGGLVYYLLSQED